MDGLLNMLTVGYEMYADIIKFVCSCAELVPNMCTL
jgi:hypothetical protein